MEIKIIINESGRGSRRLGKGRGMRNWGEGREGGPRHMGEGRRRRHGRPADRVNEGHRRFEGREGRGMREWGIGSESHDGGSRRMGEGRVIGFLVEQPDGRTRIVRKGETGGRACGMRHRSVSDQAAGQEERQARRARRRLARHIVRALEESGYGEIDKA